MREIVRSRERFSDLRKFFGLWLSLVERLVRDQEAVGSNPTSPILSCKKSVEDTSASCLDRQLQKPNLAMGSLKKRRKAIISKHMRRKRMRANRHNKRLRYKACYYCSF